jgi:hypothetical protein
MAKNSVERWAMAIMEFEGYHKGSASYRNRNPGNLKWPNTMSDTSGHSIFRNFEVGWDTLVHQLNIALTGESNVYDPTNTILEFYSKYAEGNSKQYAEFVAARFGVRTSDLIGDVFEVSQWA